MTKYLLVSPPEITHNLFARRMYKQQTDWNEKKGFCLRNEKNMQMPFTFLLALLRRELKIPPFFYGIIFLGHILAEEENYFAGVCK